MVPRLPHQLLEAHLSICAAWVRIPLSGASSRLWSLQARTCSCQHMIGTDSTYCHTGREGLLCNVCGCWVCCPTAISFPGRRPNQRRCVRSYLGCGFCLCRTERLHRPSIATRSSPYICAENSVRNDQPVTFYLHVADQKLSWEMVPSGLSSARMESSVWFAGSLFVPVGALGS